MKSLQFIFFLFVLNFSFVSFAAMEKIHSIVIKGNIRVGTEAIHPLLVSQVGGEIDGKNIREDIKNIDELGYFSDIDVYKEKTEKGFILTYVLKEKPSISKISFVGMKELKEATIKEELVSKLYTIVDDNKISQDISLIQKKYHEKGFFLVDISYRLEKLSDYENELIFVVSENGKILVAEVGLLGNHFFTDEQILAQFMSQPYTNLTAITSRSIYNRDFVTRDIEFLSYYYKDHGFSDVKISSPVIHIDRDKSFARIAIRIEEGEQYKVESLSVGGDIGPDLYTYDELMKSLSLKAGDIFKISRLHQDVSVLAEKYGDLGYAYADINPIPIFDPDKRTVKLHFEISKGKKVYFGKIIITGNSKTRDNVIRRELEVHDGELYSGTGLSKSKKNIQRLGFFDELKIQKKPSSTEEDVVDLDVSIKEKSTGELQASIGFSPGGQTAETWFAQGRYDEKNQFGRGWSLGLEGRWSGSSNILGKISFANPRVLDSQWYLGGSLSYDSRMLRFSSDYESQDKEIKVDLTVGRTIVELLRAFVTYSLSINQPSKENIFLESTEAIVTSSVKFTISRYDLDNILDPTEGLATSLSHKFVGIPQIGNQKYMETQAEISYYLPIDFTKDYRTYVKFNLVGGYLWKLDGRPLPYSARYRLGGHYDLRGYYFGEVSPVEYKSMLPTESAYPYYKGGDKKIYAQVEYFVPIIQQANIKGLVFFDTGGAFEEGESINLKKFKSDVGFGFRWKTPIAPFRFEWAYPLEMSGERFLGDMKFIFSLGY